jgi:hypothetical protein
VAITHALQARQRLGELQFSDRLLAAHDDVPIRSVGQSRLLCARQALRFGGKDTRAWTWLASPLNSMPVRCAA